MLDIRQGGNTILRRKFSSSSAEKLRTATTLCSVSEIFRGRKSLWIKGGGLYQDFPSKTISLTVPKIFPGESLTASLISSLEKC